MSFSIDYRKRLLEYLEEGHTQAETQEVFKVGTTTIKEWKKLLSEKKTLEKKHRYSKRGCIHQIIMRLCERAPPSNFERNSRAFRRIHLRSRLCPKARENNFKKATVSYSERNEEKRAEFEEKISQIPAGTPIAYVDECGIEQHMSRNRARSPRWERVVVARPGRRFKRINVVAGQCGTDVIGEVFYDWTTDSRWFKVWFEWYFCPYLCPKSVIIMDNARFHRKSQLEQIAKFYGYKILWLPPYSPDKNPIEHLWANLKNWLCNWAHLYSSIQQALLDYFKLE